MTISIEHTEEQGTILAGTSRGDGTAEVVKALGWRWGRSIASWYIPRSRDVPPKRALIARTADALRAAGHDVDVQVDATVGDRDEREARLADRSEARTERLTARAEREHAASDARDAAASRISDGIPFGQPILVGHHSERRHRRDLAKIHGHMEAAIDHWKAGNAAEAAARTSAAATAARHNPVTVANRIDRLAASIRRDERELEKLVAAGRTSGGYHQSLTDRLEADRADLEHWTRVRAQQQADGVATNYSRENVAKGDAVKVRGHWHRVARANAKTVSLETEYSWTRTTPWHEVQDHRRAETATQAAGINNAGPTGSTPGGQ